MEKKKDTNKPEAEKNEQFILADEVKKASDTEILFSKLLAILEEKQKNDPVVQASVSKSNFTYDNLNTALVGKEPVAVAFPPCSDVLLGLIDSVPNQAASSIGDLTVNHLFAEYFSFGDISGSHRPLPDNAYKDQKRLDNLYALSYCLNQSKNWPPSYCFPSPCIIIEGNRRMVGTRKLRRLFIGDLAWLYYVERMGTFQMLGRILDEYAYNGGIPMSNGSVHQDVKDDMIALVLEAMTRQTEAGNSSKVRDRATSTLRCFNWNTDAGSALGLNTTVNTAFDIQFRKLIQLALQFYKDKRLGVAIRGTNENTAGITSTATLVTIRDTINLLRRSFDNFNYGRNYHNTLSGIVWAIAGLKLVEELRQTLGIPPEYTQPADFIPAAYDILVLKRPITSGESNRFETHMECARNIRSILLDLEVLEFSDTSVNGQLEGWLNAAESNIEGYRTAYRTLTGIDLGTDTSTV
jgi:hypothetical protein